MHRPGYSTVINSNGIKWERMFSTGRARKSHSCDPPEYFAERVWGVSLRYDLGSGHPLTGRSVPDFELVDGTTVGSLLREGKGLLLDFDPAASLQVLASHWREQVIYVAQDARDRLGLRAVLIRPDGFVAWACEGSPDDEEAAQALSRWFG
jgi:hypothetical protein